MIWDSRFGQATGVGGPTDFPKTLMYIPKYTLHTYVVNCIQVPRLMMTNPVALESVFENAY